MKVNLKKLVLISLFVFIFVNSFAFLTNSIENPKSLIDKIGVRYNYFYEVLELENKFILDCFLIKTQNINLGFYTGINLHTQAPGDLRGHYALYDIFGIIGFYSEYRLWEKYIFTLHPLYHESSHYSDGILKAPSREDESTTEFTDQELEGVSQECIIAEIEYKADNKTSLYIGGGYYYHSTSRHLEYFVHCGEDINFSLGAIPLILSSDLGIIKEEIDLSYTVNLGFGLSYEKRKYLLSFERQRGLGKDYRNIQNKFGIEVVFVP